MMYIDYTEEQFCARARWRDAQDYEEALLKGLRSVPCNTEKSRAALHKRLDGIIDRIIELRKMAKNDFPEVVESIA